MLDLRAFLALLASLLCASIAQAQSNACLSAHEGAQRLRRDGQFLEARQQLLQCAQTDCPRIVRNDCAGWLGEVEAATPSLVLAVASRDGADLVDVRVTANEHLLAEQLDGRAIEVDPGVYKLRFEAAGHAPREQTLNVREAEKNRFVRVELDPLPAARIAPTQSPSAQATQEPAARVWPAVALGGFALAAGGGALGFGIWGKREHDAVRDRCGRARSCDEDDVAAGKRAYVIADVFTGIAAVSMVGAIWLYVHANRAETAPRDTALTVTPTREGLRVSWSRAF